jgi:uncharacterized protein YndB with AHSA1/START domain
MKMNSAIIGDAIVQEITIEAPADRVFEALTNPQQRMEWWGSEGRFQVRQFESDLRPGGQWSMRGNGMGGKPFVIAGEYREVERPRLLVFTWLPDWYENAAETLVRWELSEKNGVTTVRLIHSGLDTEAARTSHRGWPQILEWLRAYSEAGGSRAR